MAVVSLTMGVHSGGEQLAQDLAAALGARCISREVLLEAAKAYNIPEAKICQVFESTPSFWERMTESRRTFLAYIQATLADWVRTDALVYHGNAGQEILREVPHVLRVRIDVPLAQRIQQAMEETGASEDQARKLIAQTDEERAKRLRYFFNADWREISLYDLVINTERLTLEGTKAVVLQLTESPQYRLTPEKAQPFADYLIKCKVQAMLAGTLVGRLSLIQVDVTDNVVTLGGTLTSHETALDQLCEEIEQLPSVTEVRNEIVVGVVYHEWNV